MYAGTVDIDGEHTRYIKINDEMYFGVEELEDHIDFAKGFGITAG